MMKFKEIELEQTRIVEELAKQCEEITGYEFTANWSNLKNCYLKYQEKMIFIVVFKGVTYRLFDNSGCEVEIDHLEQKLIQSLLE